ncbi:MAG: TIGR03009 domain-containing protein [Pirellulales bacterium]|nr:TIGR03009 domain-containing protein [Pirellulales bacterium]
MMRLTWVSILALVISAPTLAQQTRQIPGYARSAQSTQRPTGSNQVGTNQAVVPQRGAARGHVTDQAAVAKQAAAPFPPLSPAAQAQLQQLLQSWEQQSKGTKTLDCKFRRWHYDNFGAPRGIHTTYADGVIKYAAPDKGLFRVDNLLFFKKMVGNQPQFGPIEEKFGEHWICTGEELYEMDRSKKECRIQDLPPEIRGQQIFNSPLPFVFNLDAQQIQQRFWVRLVQPPQGQNVHLVEAWPKYQEDRAQYKVVRIALDKKTFLPNALIMYAPNFHEKHAPKWDHYEFTDIKRNKILQGINQFINHFIPEKPPGDWKILRERYVPPSDLPIQQAAAPRHPAQR